MIRLRVPHHAALAGSPEDFDVELVGVTGGEHAHRVVARTIAATRDHFLSLDNGAAADLDLRANAAGVRARALEADGKAWSGRVVAVNTGGRIHAVHDHVEITVVVQIGQRHAVRDADRVETPLRAGIFEGQVVAVAERNAGSLSPRDFRQAFQTRLGGFPSAGSADFADYVGVLHVMVGAGGNEEVFPAVEVHVQKSDAPGPVRGRDAGELGNLSERAVTTGELEGIACDLGPEVRVPDGPGDGAPQRVRSLPGAELPSRTQHVCHVDVIEAVPVDVSDVHAHGRKADITKCATRRRSKAFAFLVEPDTVRPIDKIIAHIKVRQPVAVEVTKHHGETPIRRRAGKGSAIFVEKHSHVPTHWRKPAAATVDVEEVPFTPLYHFQGAAGGRQSHKAVARLDTHRAIRQPARRDPQPGRIILERVGTVIGDVEVEVAVAIHVGQR